VKKGFTAVTMKDIVEECGISRGGLYRYFGSTKQIFKEILAAGIADNASFCEECIKKGFSAKKIMELFLQPYKQKMLNIEKTLSVAAYEFFLSQRKAKEIRRMYQKNFDSVAAVFSKVVSYGIARKEIPNAVPEDAGRLARFIILHLRGLSILALSAKAPPEIIQEQLDLVMEIFQ
jgi:AcrR family transcriptional regulator